MKTKEDPKDNPEDRKVSRREATKKLLAGGGIVGASTMNAEKWVKPIVDSTALPAHADTTEDEEAPVYET